MDPPAAAFFPRSRSLPQPVFEEEASSPKDKAPEEICSGTPLDADLPLSGHQHEGKIPAQPSRIPPQLVPDQAGPFREPADRWS